MPLLGRVRGSSVASPGGRPPNFPRKKVGGVPSVLATYGTAGTEKYNSILYERINGNSELTEMENVIFYVSYGILTIFLRMNVILTYFATDNGDTETEERQRNAGNHA